MVAMGLPTSLKAGSAESNGDEYSVWATDPSSRLDSLQSDLATNPMPQSPSSSAVSRKGHLTSESAAGPLPQLSADQSSGPMSAVIEHDQDDVIVKQSPL